MKNESFRGLCVLWTLFKGVIICFSLFDVTYILLWSRVLHKSIVRDATAGGECVFECWSILKHPQLIYFVFEVFQNAIRCNVTIEVHNWSWFWTPIHSTSNLREFLQEFQLLQGTLKPAPTMAATATLTLATREEHRWTPKPARAAPFTTSTAVHAYTVFCMCVWFSKHKPFRLIRASLPLPPVRLFSLIS